MQSPLAFFVQAEYLKTGGDVASAVEHKLNGSRPALREQHSVRQLKVRHDAGSPAECLVSRAQGHFQIDAEVDPRHALNAMILHKRKSAQMKLGLKLNIVERRKQAASEKGMTGLYRRLRHDARASDAGLGPMPLPLKRISG